MGLDFLHTVNNKSWTYLILFFVDSLEFRKSFNVYQLWTVHFLDLRTFCGFFVIFCAFSNLNLRIFRNLGGDLKSKFGLDDDEDDISDDQPGNLY